MARTAARLSAADPLESWHRARADKTGGLARATLGYLAEDPRSRDTVAWAMTNAAEPAERVEPLAAMVGALVYLALRSELLIERDPKKGVTVRFHLKPIEGSHLRDLFSQLVGLFVNAQPGPENTPPNGPGRS